MGGRADVSTHSRPKAAGPTGETTEIIKNGFNTQPPEGGWVGLYRRPKSFLFVSTHSRPKAAGR